MEQLLALLTPLIELYGGKLGFLPAVISIIGTLRLFVKPVMSAIQNYVDLTPSDKDDALVDEIKSSKVYQYLVYGLDWFASIKLPKK